MSSNLAEWQLHGPVRMVRKEIAEWDRSQQSWKPTRHFNSASFDPDGRIREVSHYNPNGSVSVSNYLYDQAERLTEVRFQLDDGPITRTLRWYDEAGRPLRTVDVGPDGAQRDRESYRYDDRGWRTRVLFVESPHQSRSFFMEGSDAPYGAPGAKSITLICDEHSGPIEALQNDSSHEALTRIIVTRDANGRVLTEEMHLPSTNPFPDIEQKFDEAPPEERTQLMAMLTQALGPSMTLASTTYAYDDKGRVAERIRLMGALREERTTFRYDERGNPIEEVTESAERGMNCDEAGHVHATNEQMRGQVTHFEYQYDTHGNWTERVVGTWSEDAGFQRSNVERRTIDYYGQS